MKTRIKKDGNYVAAYNKAEKSGEWVGDPAQATVFPDLVEAVKAAKVLELPNNDISYDFDIEPRPPEPLPPVPFIAFTRAELTDLWHACEEAKENLYSKLRGEGESYYTDEEKNAMGQNVGRLTKLETKIGRELFSLV